MIGRLKLSRQPQRIIPLLFIGLITYALAGIFYDVLLIKLLKTTGTKKVIIERPAPQIFTAPSPGEYAVIWERNIFGSTDKPVSLKTKKSQMAQEFKDDTIADLSSLLIVRGTVVITARQGYAIIEQRGANKQQLLRVGNAVSGARLIKVARNSATFKYNNREVILKAVQGTETPLLPARSGNIPSPQVPPSKQEPMPMDREEIRSQLRDLGSLMTQVQVRPYYTQGIPMGYIVTGIKPGSIFEKMGLKEGDIIEGTKDRKLTTTDDWNVFYNALKTESEITLKIKRNGSDELLRYVLR